MPKPDASSVIRIAIALAALKHKPRDQSIASYILDLQSRFPLVRNQSGTREDENGAGPSAGPASEPDGDTQGKWRSHALELEKQLAALKAQRDADQDLLSKLRADASQAKAAASDAPPPKKKSKKNTTKDPQEPQWNWDQSRADWSIFLHSQLPPPPSLVAAYTSLKGALFSSNEDQQSYAPRLTDVIHRAFETIYVFLFSVQQTQSSPISPIQAKTEHLDSAHIAMASPLLMYVLRTALPSLVRMTHENSKTKRQRLHSRSDYDAHIDINKATNYLLDFVLLPLLRSFAPMCGTRLAALLDFKKSKTRDKGKGKQSGKTPSVAPPKLSDTRTDILALLGASLAALDALPSYPGLCADGSIATGIRVRLGLETIRELEALYAGPSRPPPQPQPRSSQPTAATESEKRAKRLETLAGTREERIRALAVKDAAWYLASMLNLCVPQSAADNIADGMGRDASDLLREALVDRVGKLVRSVIHVGRDDVERNSNGDVQAENGKANGYTVDPVCQSMLLAVCERALSGFAPA